jgi:hypothetical protein
MAGTALRLDRHRGMEIGLQERPGCTPQGAGRQMSELDPEEIAGAKRIAQLLVGLPQDTMVSLHRRLVIERAARLMLAKWEPAPAFARAQQLGEPGHR